MEQIAAFDPSGGSSFVVLDDTHTPEILERLDAECLDEAGRLKVMPADFYARCTHEEILTWCTRRGFYCLPTFELLELLKQQIAGEPAIEIGAGHGAIGRALGIPATDSKQQERPEIARLYEKLGQDVVTYPSDVEKLTALEAAEKYRPRVVVAAWVTHRYDRNAHWRGGNQNGVDEGRLLDKSYLRRYVFVGNGYVHRYKPIRERRHQTHELPLFSRAHRPELDAVWVWEMKGKRR